MIEYSSKMIEYFSKDGLYKYQFYIDHYNNHISLVFFVYKIINNVSMGNISAGSRPIKNNKIVWSKKDSKYSEYLKNSKNEYLTNEGKSFMNKFIKLKAFW